MTRENNSSHEARLVALEFVVADIIANIYRTTTDPLLSIDIKRQKFRWLFGEKGDDLTNSIGGRLFPEVQVAVEELLELGGVLARMRGFL